MDIPSQYQNSTPLRPKRRSHLNPDIRDTLHSFSNPGAEDNSANHSAAADPDAFERKINDFMSQTCKQSRKRQPNLATDTRSSFKSQDEVNSENPNEPRINYFSGVRNNTRLGNIMNHSQGR